LLEEAQANHGASSIKAVTDTFLPVAKGPSAAEMLAMLCRAARRDVVDAGAACKERRWQSRERLD